MTRVFGLRLKDLQASVALNNTTLTKQKIVSFKNLPSGWHYGEGVAPVEPIIETAHDWHKKIAEVGFTTTDAFPGIGGEIMICGKNKNREVEIILETDGTVSFDYNKDDETIIEIERGNAKEVEDALNAAAGEPWSISDLSINDILSRARIVSTDWHFEIMAAAPPSSYMNVSWYPALPYVDIFDDTIQPQPESRRFFGLWTSHQVAVVRQSLLSPR